METPVVTHIKRGGAQITTKSPKPWGCENASCVLGNPKHHLDRVAIFEAFSCPGGRVGLGMIALVEMGRLGH